MRQADRWADQWRTLPALYREDAAADAAPLHPDDIVVIDNLGSHCGKTIRRIIRSVGAKLFFLPKYSPDLNPIEQLLSKLKHWLRKAARRSVKAVSHAIGHTLGAVTSKECRNYFANAGYEPA